MPLNRSWVFTITELYLACSYEFVVSELCQLCPQCQVRVNQECLSTTLVEILEWQTFREIWNSSITVKSYSKRVLWEKKNHTCIWRVVFIFQLKFHQQFENSSAKREDNTAMKNPCKWLAADYIIRACATLHLVSSCEVRASGMTEREHQSAAPAESSHRMFPQYSAGTSHTPTTAS